MFLAKYRNVDEIRNIVMTTGSGAMVKLMDIATVRDGFQEPENFARFDGENVITLNVIKKSGENLLSASDKIDAVIEEMKTNQPACQPEDRNNRRSVALYTGYYQGTQ